MLHVFIDPYDTTAWYPNYLSGLKKGLEKAGVAYRYSENLPNNESDPILITRFTLFEQFRHSVPVRNPLYIMEHDVWNPFTNVVDPATLWIFKHPSLRAILYTNPSMVPWGERCLEPGSKVKVLAAGFPYDHEKLEQVAAEVQPTAARDKLIVFPGRLNEFYQPYVSVRMAMELRERGYRTVIASPIDPQCHYPVSLWQELGIEVGRLAQPDYYRLLARAQAAITVTIGGSLTLALYEAHLLGAKPIAPMDRSGLPPFTEVYEPRYDILNPREALQMIEDNTPIRIDTKWFDSDFYVANLLNAVEEWS